MIDVTSIKNFLDWAEIEKDGKIEVHSLTRIEKTYKRKKHAFYSKPEQVIAFAESNQDDLVVVGINPRPTIAKESAKDSDIQIYKNFYIDIEPIHSAEETVSEDALKRCEEFTYEVIEKVSWLSRFGVKAYSGNGYHILCALPVSDSLNPNSVYEHLKSFYKDILAITKDSRDRYKCRIDNTFSPSRQVKLYGTRKPILDSRLSFFPQVKREESKELLDIVMSYEVVVKEKVEVKIDLKKEKESLGKIEEKLARCGFSLQYLSNNPNYVALSDPSRSGKDFVVCMSLVRAGGFSDSEIYTVINNLEYNSDKEITEQYITHTLKKVRESFMEEAKPPTGTQSDPKVKQNKFIRYADLREKEYIPPVLFKTGLSCLDNYLDGGLALGELSMILAPQETGKSNLACFIGANCKKQGYNVLHVYFNEDDDGAIKKRYDSVLAIDHSDSEVFFSKTSMKIDLPDIEEGIKEHNPGLVIVDYLNRLPSIGEGDRFRIKSVLEKFGDLAKESNCHIMICDHVTVTDPWIDYQKWDEKRIQEAKYKMRHTRVAESKMYKLALVSVMIGMLRSDEADNIVYFTGMKMKRKNNKLFCPVLVDYDNCSYRELV